MDDDEVRANSQLFDLIDIVGRAAVAVDLDLGLARTASLVA
jgi:hypothetical protein